MAPYHSIKRRYVDLLLVASAVCPRRAVSLSARAA
jgi:hypothetical protein